MNQTVVEVLGNVSLSKIQSYAFLFIFLVTLILTKRSKVYQNKKAGKSVSRPNKSSPNKDRKYGTWIPEDFKLPIPPKYPEWDYETTKPLPYRAFKHKYSINMGIRNMNWELWIELDNEWKKFHDEKMQRVALHGDKFYRTHEDAVDAAYELLEDFRAYLPSRYPLLFQMTEYGVKNLQTGEYLNFMGPYRNYTGPNCGAEDPMLIAAKMVQDDLAILLENEDGEYILKAGAIILPGFWKLEDKYMMTLEKIHTSGDVPKFKEKLQSPMEKFFIRLGCDKPVVRNNYFLQTDDELGWSSSIGAEFGEKVGWYTAEEATDIKRIHFRSERQSLRRLPKSGGIVFTIRTYFLPICQLAEEPYVPRRLLNGILSWEDDVQEYRGYTKFKDILLPYLQEKAEAQEQQGYSEKAETLPYPY